MKGILGMLPIIQHSLADTQDHWAVARDQGGKAFSRTFRVSATMARSIPRPAHGHFVDKADRQASDANLSSSGVQEFRQRDASRKAAIAVAQGLIYRAPGFPWRARDGA